MINIVIPSFGRPERIHDVVVNASDNTGNPCFIWVVVEPEQVDDYVMRLPFNKPVGLVANSRSRNYAGAVNTVANLMAPDPAYLFLGADDLNFNKFWDIPALQTMGALPNIKVVGTNDLYNPYVLKGYHATHYLIDFSYIQDPGGVVDGEKGLVLHEGYDHNFTDTEFIATAKQRAVFAPCLGSVVEHNHFTAGKSRLDATYEKGTLNLERNRTLYYQRQSLWMGISR